MEGLEFVSIHNYSFAPFNSFGGGFHGDGTNRKYGDAVYPNKKMHKNFRIGAKVVLNLSTEEVVNKYPYGSMSQWLDTDADYSDAEFQSFSYENGELNFHLAGNNDEFIIPFMTPDIDVHLDITFTKLTENTFKVDGSVVGDRFPSNETYLTDAEGNKIFLGVSGPDNTAGNGFWGPLTELGAEGGEEMQQFSFFIVFDENELFSSVIFNGISYTVDEWNSMFTGLDPQGESTGTSIDAAGVNVNYQ